MIGRDHHRRLSPFNDGAGPAVPSRLGGQFSPFGRKPPADRVGVVEGCGGVWRGVTDEGVVTEGPGGGGGGLDCRVVVADDPVAHLTSGGGLPGRAGGRRWLRRSPRGEVALEALDDARRDAGGRGAEALEESERDFRIGGRRHAGAGGDEVERVADDIGEDEGDEPPGGARSGQAARLDGACRPADGVEAADVSAGAGEEAGDGDLVVEGEAVARRCQQRRTSAGDQRHRQVVGPEAAEALHHRGGGCDDARRGEIDPGGPSFANLDGGEIPAAALRHTDEPGETLGGEAGGGQSRFEPRGKRRGGLPGSNDDDPAGRRGLEEIGRRHGEEPLRGDRADRRPPDLLRVSAEARRRGHHPPGGGWKFFGSNLERSIPPRASSSRSLTRDSRRSRRRARSAGDSAEGVDGAGRGTEG